MVGEEKRGEHKMEINLLYTTDPWCMVDSYRLRGVFTDLDALDQAKRTLLANGVVESEQELHVTTVQDGDFEPDGGCIR